MADIDGLRHNQVCVTSQGAFKVRSSRLGVVGFTHSTCFPSQAADSPHLLSVPMTWVKEGGMVRLNKKYLQADYKGVSSDDVVYTLHTRDGHPKYGNA